MKILIDTADIKTIEDLYKIYRFDGVTTNPNLLSRIDGDPMEILKSIKSTIPEGAELHVQVISSTKEEMLHEAELILEELGRETHIKIPVCTEGYSAIKELSERGVNVTATAIFNNAQALMAAHSGATYVAPYIHRINNKSYDGVGTALSIQELLITQQLSTNLLAAAFESVGQVMEVLSSGANSVTVAPDILREVFDNIMTEEAVVDFRQNFQGKFGKESMGI